MQTIERKITAMQPRRAHGLTEAPPPPLRARGPDPGGRGTRGPGRITTPGAVRGPAGRARRRPGGLDLSFQESPRRLQRPGPIRVPIS
jgi:hypothetical protein